MQDQKQDYLKYIQPYLFSLLKIDSLVVSQFLDKVCRKHQFSLESEHNGNKWYFKAGTQYINPESFEEEYL